MSADKVMAFPGEVVQAKYSRGGLDHVSSYGQRGNLNTTTTTNFPKFMPAIARSLYS